MAKLSECGRVPRLLLIEDNRGDAILFRRAVQKIGYELDVYLMPSAEDALDFLERRKADPSSLPDLIVSDLNLPQQSGLDFLRTLKLRQDLRRIPCIILTSSTTERDIAEAYDNYANGYMSKPATVEELREIITVIGSYWFSMVQLPSGSFQKFIGNSIL